jgi:hypothetical protein
MTSRPLLYNVLFDESLSASLHWNPFTSLKLARMQADFAETNARPILASTTPPPSVLLSSASAPHVVAGANANLLLSSTHHNSAPPAHHLPQHLPPSVAQPLAVPTSPGGGHKRAKSSGNVPKFSNSADVAAFESRQFSDFESVLAAGSAPILAASVGGGAASNRSSYHASSASATPVLMPTKSTSAAMASAASAANNANSRSSSVSGGPVSLDWSNIQTMANLRSILASIDTDMEEVPFGTPMGSPPRFASPLNVPPTSAANVAPSAAAPSKSKLSSSTSAAPPLAPKTGKKASVVFAAAVAAPPSSASSSLSASGSRKPSTVAPTPDAPPALPSKKSSKAAHMRRSKSPPARTSPQKLSDSRSSSGSSGAIADADAPPELPKKSKKRSDVASAVPQSMRESRGDKPQRSPSRRAFDDMFGADDIVLSSNGPPLPSKPISKATATHSQTDLRALDASSKPTTLAPLTAPTTVRSKSPRKSDPTTATAAAAAATAPAPAAVAPTAPSGSRRLRSQTSTGMVPRDVADAKRALLQLKAGMALQENSLVSLAGAQRGESRMGDGIHGGGVTVLKPVRKPKSRDEAAMWIQAVWRMVVVRRRYKREWQRLRIAREMVATEESYVHSIETAFATFFEPLLASARSSKPMASEVDVEVIFSRLAEILPLNSYLASQLATRVAKWKPDSCIGDVFLDFAQFHDSAFRQVYEEYTVHYYVAIERVQTCSSNPRFRQWLDEKQAGGASLQSYLIMPIQRLARYVLLLRQMRKFTIEPHADTKALDEAVALMTVVVGAINEAERTADTNRTAVRQLQELNEKLDPHMADLAQAGRRWIANGEVQHLTVLDMRVHPRHYELLSDTILLTKQRGRTKLALKQRASLAGGRVRTLEAADMAALGSADPSLRNCLELHTPSQGFIFAFASDAERKRFIAAFEKCDTAARKVAPPAVLSVVRSSVAPVGTVHITPKTVISAEGEQMSRPPALQPPPMLEMDRPEPLSPPPSMPPSTSSRDTAFTSSQSSNWSE